MLVEHGYLATCTEDHLGVRDHGAAPDSVHGQMGFNAVVGYLPWGYAPRSHHPR
jgi:hypothetical protein